MSRTRSRRRPTRPLLPVLCLLGALHFAAPLFGVASSASARDYDPESSDWNGASYLLRTANEAKVDVDWKEILDWSNVTADTVLVWLYPRQPMPMDAIDAFLRDGGRLVVADDFGTSDALLRRYGILRSEAPPRHRTFLRGDPSLPVLAPPRAGDSARSDHFLFFNIAPIGETLVANHPASFTLASSDATAIVTFDDPRQVFAAEVRVGDGAILAISDASLFINEMLYLHADKQFVANALRYYCKADPCRAVIVDPIGQSVGTYIPREADLQESLLDRIRRLSAELNTWVHAAQARLTPRTWSYLFGIFGMGLLLSLLARLFAPIAPLRAFAWETPAQSWRTDLDHLAEGMAAARESADFGRPAVALVALVESALGLVGSPPRDGAAREAVAAAFLRARAIPNQDRGAVRQAILNAFAFSHSVRGVRGRNPQPPPLSAEAFTTLFDDATRVLVAAGAVEPHAWNALASRARASSRRAPSGHR